MLKNLLHKNNSQPNNTIEREPLRWLFTAVFADGTTIVQTQEDKCFTRTDGTGSAFTDVLAREDELVAFVLRNVDGKQDVLVDLKSGAFSVNSTPINIHDQNFDPSKHKLRLIYFRESRIETDVHGIVETDGSIARKDNLNQRHFVNRYFIGWQTTVIGKNKQATLAVG